MQINPKLIKKQFEKSFNSYNQNAIVQRLMAEKLVKNLSLIKTDFNSILELGCGTVILTKEIVKAKNGDAQSAVALEQIKTRNYAHAFRYHPGREAVLVGITYDAESKHHRCLIEKMENYKEAFGVVAK